jgi:hypothetical protein
MCKGIVDRLSITSFFSFIFGNEAVPRAGPNATKDIYYYGEVFYDNGTLFSEMP